MIRYESSDTPAQPERKLAKTLDVLARIETAPKREAVELSEVRVPFQNRISETVVKVYKDQPGKTAGHVEAALLEYAEKMGWL